MNLVAATFDQTSQESVTATVRSIYTHLDDEKLPALDKTPVFQKKIVELLNEKLKKALRHMYDQFIMKMLEFRKDMFPVDDWTYAFNHVHNTAVKNDTKAALWAEPNPNSSNSRGDRSFLDTD